jgi:hypothetical protein
MLELRHWWLAPVLRLHFSATRKKMLAMRRDEQRLLLLVLLRRSRRSFVIMSCWSEPAAMMESAVGEHIAAVYFAQDWCRAIWSTQWHLTRVSPSCRTWPGSIVDWSAIARAAGADGTGAAAVTACSGKPYDTTSERYGVSRTPRTEGASEPDAVRAPATSPPD